jgi:hypothetical protein
MFDWKTHQIIKKIPRLALAANGGPQFLLGNALRTADYKGGKGAQILSYGVYTYLQCGSYTPPLPPLSVEGKGGGFFCEYSELPFFHYAVYHTDGRYQFVGRSKNVDIPYM